MAEGQLEVKKILIYIVSSKIKDIIEKKCIIKIK